MTPIADPHFPRPLSRLSLGACLALLSACPPDTAQPTTTAAETDATSTGTPGTSGEPTTGGSSGPATTEPGSTSTGPAPVCGDGIVDGDEPCDDGNDDAEDGCNSNCEPTAAVEWTKTIDFNKKNDGVGDVVVDATGRIIIAGWAGDPAGGADQLILVLDPEGNEVWKQTFDGEAGFDDFLVAVEVDDEGRIFAAGREGLSDTHAAHSLRVVDPDGAPLGEFKEPNVETDFATLQDLEIVDGTVYSVGYQENGDKGGQTVFRAHDPAALAMPLWRADTNAGTFYASGQAIAHVGPDLLFAGFAGAKFSETLPMTGRVTLDGVIAAVVVEDAPDALWNDIEPIGDAGDLLLAGRRVTGVTLPDAIVRRVTSDGGEVWTDVYDDNFLYDAIFSVAVGPDEAVLAGGVAVRKGENDNALVRRLSGDGAVRWTSLYNNPDLDLYEVVVGVAFGPDFVVAAGRSSVLGQGTDLWVRRFQAD